MLKPIASAIFQGEKKPLFSGNLVRLVHCRGIILNSAISGRDHMNPKKKVIALLAWAVLAAPPIAAATSVEDTAIILARAIKQRAHDPSSIVWVAVVHVAPSNYCFEYRGRNGFNAIVLEHHAFIVKDGRIKDSGWNACAGKSGTDFRLVVKYNT